MLEHFAIENGYINLVKFRDIASGLNLKRRGLRKIFKLIDANKIATIIVNYKDRLNRFGFKYLKSYFNLHGTKILVLNQEAIQDPQKELVDDLIAIVIMKVLMKDRAFIRSDPVERSRMMMRMERAVRNCKETIIREASQCNEIREMYPLLPT
ncbi:MAG: recombinase family protein [Promethearchaeota archaeon]